MLTYLAPTRDNIFVSIIKINLVCKQHVFWKMKKTQSRNEERKKSPIFINKKDWHSRIVKDIIKVTKKDKVKFTN